MVKLPRSITKAFTVNGISANSDKGVPPVSARSYRVFFFFIFTIILIIRWHVYYYLTHEVENVGIKTHSNMPVAGIFGA